MGKNKKHFQHFLVTRFNVYIDFFRQNGVNTDIRLQEAWLEQRFYLFDQFCFSSVRGQNNQDFLWLVLFDEKTPDVYKERIGKYGHYKNFIPQYLVAFDSIETLRQRILSYIEDPRPSHLITTRLDSDDAISTDYVQRIHDKYQAQDEQYLNFTSGFQWCKTRLYNIAEPSNHFISLIEKLENFKTVYTGAHQHLSKGGQVLQIQTRPSWIEVIHDTNVVNRLHGLRVSNQGISDNFTLNLSGSIPAESQLSIFLSQLWFHLRRRFRVFYSIFAESIRRRLISARHPSA